MREVVPDQEITGITSQRIYYREPVITDFMRLDKRRL